MSVGGSGDFQAGIVAGALIVLVLCLAVISIGFLLGLALAGHKRDQECECGEELVCWRCDVDDVEH